MCRKSPFSPRAAETGLENKDYVAVLLKYRFELLHVAENDVHFRVIRLGCLIVIVLVGKAHDGFHAGITMCLKALSNDVESCRTDVAFHKISEIEHAQCQCLITSAVQ